MKIGLDTSVLLRFLIGEPKPQAERAWQAIVEMRAAKNEVVVSDLVVSETYFALQFHYGVPKSAALEQLRALLESKHVTPTGCAGQVLAKPGLANAKPGFVDRMIHAAYSREGGEMLTFEKAAVKLSHTRVLKGTPHPNPLPAKKCGEREKPACKPTTHPPKQDSSPQVENTPPKL